MSRRGALIAAFACAVATIRRSHPPAMFRFASGGAFLLGSGFWFLNAPPPPTVYVNENNEMLSAWPSEAMGAPSSMPPECSFFDFAVRFDATLCSHFTIARVASVPAQAMRRALRCAGA